jgi:hypothetical protein
MYRIRLLLLPSIEQHEEGSSLMLLCDTCIERSWSDVPSFLVVLDLAVVISYSMTLRSQEGHRC